MFDSAAPLCTVLKPVHNDAVESIICCRSGSQTARVAHAMLTPVCGVRVVCAMRAVYEPLRRQIPNTRY
eukprot:6497851-Lingulodinium_polyedra.AAC.1